MVKKFLLLLGAACAAPAFAAEGYIPEHPALKERFWAGGGIFHAKTATSAQLDSASLGVGTNVDFERALGMDKTSTSPYAFARMRFGERWRAELEYFELNRSGSRVIDRTIQWGDRVYAVNTQLESRFEFADLRVSAGYALFRSPDKELGVAFGVHATSYDVTLNGQLAGQHQEDVIAPLPVLSLYGQFALTDRWAVSSRLDRFSLSYEKYDGSLTALGVDLLYQPFRHVGFGAGFRSLFIDLTVTDERKAFKFNQSFQGPVLFVNVSF
jgi:hypothetical protein